MSASKPVLIVLALLMVSMAPGAVAHGNSSDHPDEDRSGHAYGHDEDSTEESEDQYYASRATDDDIDGDGLPDVDEAEIGTDFQLWDTDGDGYNDLREVQDGSDPLDPNSQPDENPQRCRTYTNTGDSNILARYKVDPDHCLRDYVTTLVGFPPLW